MSYLSAQNAAGNIWCCTIRMEPDLYSKLMELDIFGLDLTAPELLPDEELIEAHELLGSIFHHPDWNRLYCNATSLPIPGGSFDYYCIERVYLAFSHHVHNRAWEHDPKHTDWLDSFKSMTTTGGYVYISQANDSHSWDDPAFEGALDAPTWFPLGGCVKPVNPGVLQIDSMPRNEVILARLSNCKYED